MDPERTYSLEIYDHIKKQREKEKLCSNKKKIGKGAAGNAYIADIKIGDHIYNVILKRQELCSYSINELEALRHLRRQMLASKLPNYYLFMYGDYIHKKYSYFILEKIDIKLEDYLTDYNIFTETYFSVFFQIARAISFLENEEFNHGDLWIENVMLNWKDGQDEKPIEEREFDIKLIDYDAACKNNSKINCPNRGGSVRKRIRFLLGYDLNRFYDALLYTYNDYMKKKLEYKIKNISRRHAEIDEDTPSDIEYDRINIVYPTNIVNFMNSLPLISIDKLRDHAEMSGENIMTKIIETAKELNIEIA